MALELQAHDAGSLSVELTSALATWRQQAMALWELTAQIGEILDRARRTIGDEDWLDWLAGADLTPYGAFVFMRATAYPALMREHKPGSVEAIRRLLPQGEGTAYDREQGAMARRLHERGMTRRDLGIHFGASPNVLTRWLNPEEWREQQERAREANRERGRAAAARRQAEREQVIKRALVREGEAFNALYLWLTAKGGPLLEQAYGEAGEREKRLAVREMQELRNQMVDLATKYLGVP